MEPIASSPGVRPEPEPQGRGFRRNGQLLAVTLLAALSTGAGSAQRSPGLGSEVSAFASLPADLTPDFPTLEAPILLGYSLGGFLQTRHVLGAEVRGSIQRRGNAQHQEWLVAGPRAALHFGRVTPYTCFLIGVANGWRYKTRPPPGEEPPKPVESMGSQWTVLGGVDVRVTPHFAVRLGELSYSTLYLKNWDLYPVNVSAGVVWRLR